MIIIVITKGICICSQRRLWIYRNRRTRLWTILPFQVWVNNEVVCMYMYMCVWLIMRSCVYEVMILHVYVYVCEYSGTSNKGPSEKGTTSLQRTLPISPKVYIQYISTSEKRTASLQGTKWLVPKCPLFGGSTVWLYVCVCTCMCIVRVYCMTVSLLHYMRAEFCYYYSILLFSSCNKFCDPRDLKLMDEVEYCLVRKNGRLSADEIKKLDKGTIMSEVSNIVCLLSSKCNNEHLGGNIWWDFNILCINNDRHLLIVTQ